MNQTLNLFDQPENDMPWTPPTLVAKSETMELPILDHPYARYGLAVALWKAKLPEANLTEPPLREALAAAIETGLENFRLTTDDNPEGPERELHFRPIPFAELQQQKDLVYVGGINNRGRYLNPTIITCVLGKMQAQIIPRAFAKTVELVGKLRDTKNPLFGGSEKLSRSFVPIASERNNGGKDAKSPTGTLFEAACCAVTTLTPTKPAALARKLDGKVTERLNVTIIPDLGEVGPTRDFIELFHQMTISKLAADLMTAHLKPLQPAPDPERVNTKKIKADAIPKSLYHRPKLHNGNYPFAPRDAAAFGAVGLLAAIGRWAVEAEDVDKAWARDVLDSLSHAPLYLISYDKISQVRFGSHIVELAMEGELARTLDALWGRTKLYADLENALTDRSTPAYQIFYLQTSRFLQQFSRPSFADFLSNRAEYPALCRVLLDTYFAHIMISPSIVESARLLGQHLNRTAYFVANEEYPLPESGRADPKRDDNVRKAKAKILVEFESAILSAKNSVDMLHRISTRAGRLLNGDLPASADAFMDAAAAGNDLSCPDAQHLLIAYLRLRSPQQERAQKDAPIKSDSELGAATDSQNSDDIAMDDSN